MRAEETSAAMQSDDAPPIVGQGTNKEEPPAVGAESMSWAIATKLGASTAEDSDRAYVLCDHRWRWLSNLNTETKLYRRLPKNKTNKTKQTKQNKNKITTT